MTSVGEMIGGEKIATEEGERVRMSSMENLEQRAIESDSDRGPGRYFDRDEILDPSTLQVTVQSDRMEQSRHRPGREVRIIELSFVSQHWHGVDWHHPARIYVPQERAAGDVAGIIGTERECFEAAHDWSRKIIPGTSLDTEGEYAEGTAIDLGIPIMIFANPAGRAFGLDESDLAGHGFQQMMKTGDLTWNLYYPIAKSYLRAITLLGSLDGVHAERAVLLGNSKRGVGVAIAAGADPERVAGVMLCGYHGGNNLYHLATKFAEFGADVAGPSEQRTGPGFQSADTMLRALNTPVGFRMLKHFDPYLWKDRIRSSYFVALGTNDEFYALGAPNSMMSELTGDAAFLAIDNVPHTWVSAKHLEAWRMWLAHTFFDRQVPTVAVRSKQETSTVSISADIGTVDGATATLFYSHHPRSEDWRSATWESTPMRWTGDCWTAELDLRSGENLAWYVEAEVASTGDASRVSSLVHRVESGPRTRG